MSQWYFMSGGQRYGPVPLESLQAMLTAGQLPPQEFVWREGMPNWIQIFAVPELASVQPRMGYSPGGYGQGHDMGQDAGMRMLLPVGRSGWAIAAGYAGLFAFIILPAPLALILSIIAIIDIRKHPEKHGMGRAIFGLITGVLGTGFLMFGLIARMMR